MIRSQGDSQTAAPEQDLWALWQAYFRILRWEVLPSGAHGFDLLCGSGRWARADHLQQERAVLVCRGLRGVREDGDLLEAA
jgi:hypothetical protein